MTKNRSKIGFTVVEMLVIIPVVMIVIGVFIGAIVNITGEVLATRASNSLAYDIQDALNRIEQDVSLGGGYLHKNNIALTSPQGFNNDTTEFNSYSGTTGMMLIINSYVTTSNPASSERNLVYASSQPNQCNSPQVNQNSQIMFNVVYFVKNGTLWRRTIAPAGYQTFSCNLPWQKPSCESGQSGTLCKALDTKLVEHISDTNGFVVNYYTTPSGTTPITNQNSTTDATRQAAIQTAKTVEVIIKADTTVAGRDITQTGTIRATNANNNISTNTLPAACPSGFIIIPGSYTYGTNDFCVMKYEAKNAGANIPISQATGLSIMVNVTQANAISYSTTVAGCTGCHLMTESERLTIVQNVLSVASNWSSGTVGNGYIYSGINGLNGSVFANDASTDDNNGYVGTNNTAPSNKRRTLALSNGQVIWDFAGNAWEWTSNQTTGNQPGIIGAGSAWRDWNTLTAHGNLSPDPFPSFGTPAASGWTAATNGIGQVLTNADDTTTLVGFLYGGSVGDGVQTGVTNIQAITPTIVAGTVGFRVTR